MENELIPESYINGEQYRKYLEQLTRLGFKPNTQEWVCPHSVRLDIFKR